MFWWPIFSAWCGSPLNGACCFLWCRRARPVEEAAARPAEEAPPDDGGQQNGQGPGEDDGHVEQDGRHGGGIIAHGFEAIARGHFQFVQRMPVETEDPGIGEG